MISDFQPTTTPSIVAQEAVRRLPRAALLLVCVSYVLAGLIGRAPWKSVDIASFGVMQALAQGKTSWWQPALLGQLEAPALLPYWLGAWGIQLLGGVFGVEIASRIPFGLALALTFIATWYGVYYLARTKSAQPVPFAFGGEAKPTDYARSLADGSLLALMAMLGLVQLSHETSVQVPQLAFAALLFYAAAACAWHRVVPGVALVVASFGLALSGVPAFGLALACAAGLALSLQNEAHAKRWALAFVAAGGASAALAWQLKLWHANWAVVPASATDWLSLARLWIWFSWPAWPLTLVALWRWRAWWRSLHMLWPTLFLAVIVAATVLRPGADRSLMLAAPAFAALAAFALPTLHRSVSALIDWFTLLFFSLCGVAIWVVYIAMHTGSPAQPAANVRRLLPGFEPRFESWHLVAALLATLAWLGALAWRTGKHRSALWKSLVLPAGGATWCWILLMTLWMPLLDYARSYAPMISQVRAQVKGSCVVGHGLTQAQVAALQWHGSLDVIAMYGLSSCTWLVTDPQRWKSQGISIGPEWQLVQTVRRRSNDSETLLLYKQSRP